jgi:FdhD protein
MNDIAKPPGVFGDYPVGRWDGQRVAPATERVAEELPVSLVYNGLAHVVMMATPADLEDFALGFSLSEGILKSADELYATEVVPVGDGLRLSMDIDLERYLPLEEQRRNLAGRTGCGLCGAETIEQAVRHPGRVSDGPRVAHSAVERAFAALSAHQQLNSMTGAVHAAAWASREGEVLIVREDVGRHNALDKMIGGAVRARHPLDAGFALITSRASFEMVQKAASVGITIVAAISAPTGLAIRLAEETELTLLGFARGGKHNVYANPSRLTG